MAKFSPSLPLEIISWVRLVRGRSRLKSNMIFLQNLEKSRKTKIEHIKLFLRSMIDIYFIIKIGDIVIA